MRVTYKREIFEMELGLGAHFWGSLATKEHKKHKILWEIVCALCASLRQFRLLRQRLPAIALIAKYGIGWVGVAAVWPKSLLIICRPKR